MGTITSAIKQSQRSVGLEHITPIFLIFFLFLSGLASGQIAPLSTQEEPLPPIDKSREALAPGFQAERSASSAQRQAAQSLRQRIPDLKLRWNAVTGTPRNIYSTTRLLTQPTNQEARAVVRNFLNDNIALFRLTPADMNTLVRVTGIESPRDPSDHGPCARHDPHCPRTTLARTASLSRPFSRLGHRKRAISQFSR